MRHGPHRPERFGLDPVVVWGVYLGDCVADESWHDPRYHVEGHAHVADEWRGWICIPDTRRAVTKSGRPSLLLLHEVAHLMTRSAASDHGPAWREALTSIGGKREVRAYARRSVT